MLNQHPQVHWAGEIFVPYVRGKQLYKKDNLIEGVINHTRSLEASPVFGFETKCLPHHLANPVLNTTLETYVEELRRLRFSKFVILYRKNYLRRAVSAEAGIQTRKWHAKKQAKSANKVVIDVNAFRTGVRKEPLLNLFHSMDETLRTLQALFSPQEAVFLNYEDDILHSPSVAYEKVCDFLDIEVLSPPIELQRTNPFPLVDLIENFGEVTAELQNTEYGWMLED